MSVVVDEAFSDLIQICPHDSPPFLDICRVYRKAAERIGLGGMDFYLGTAMCPATEREEGVRYLGCDDLSRVRALSNLLRQELPDTSNSLVLCHRYRAYRTFLAAGAPAAGVVALAHEYGFLKRTGRRLRLRLSGRGTLFAGVGPAVVADLRKTTGQALLWPNALDFDALSYLDRSAARQALSLPNSDRVIGVVGRLHYRKQPQAALHGFRAFLDGGGSGRLAFVGDGPLRPQLEEMGEDLPVSFPGFVSNAARLMRAFDALLLTSSDEPFGMVLLEAMAAGTPVVAPRQPGPESILGPIGHYFADASPQAIAAALQAACASPNPGGLKRAQREFSVAAVAQRLALLRNNLQRQ